ncbi:MAG TPA: glycosyl hydrolase family 28-related protein [Candidatus Saccharimonadales bacterium]
MVRLPEPGGDEDIWAQLLNEYLLVAHNPDGTLRVKEKNSKAAAAGTVGLKDLNTTNSPTDPPIKMPTLSNDGTNLVWKTPIEINVKDYGAKGDGITDDTQAIQAAINAAGSGLVVFPSGVFAIRGIKVKNKGTALRGDGRFGTRIKRHSGTDPLIDVSGSGTGIGHQRWDTVSNFQLDGNNMGGALLRSYYADSCVYRELSFINCPGLSTDIVEVWDTRFENCTWEHCGSLDQPAVLLRNSLPVGEFGYGDDNTNQIYFTSCRWEGFRNGAVKLDGSYGGSTRQLNGIFFVACKMESSVLAGPALQIMTNATIIFINQLYMALLKPETGFSTPIDAIVDYGTHVFMASVYVQWGSTAALASSTIRAFRSGPHMYHEISAYYPTEVPALATIVAEPGVDVMVAAISANRGPITMGDMGIMMQSDPTFGLALSLKNSGSFRITSAITGKDLVKADNSSTRPTLHTVNGVDLAGYSGDFIGEKWRFYGDTGFVRLASGNFQIEGTKGYVGLGIAPYIGIALLIKMANDTDRGLTIIRKSATATGRLIEFQDENFNVQGIAFDAHGRPLSVGRVANVAPGDQVAYANVRVQARDTGGSVAAAMKDSPASGSIAVITFFKPYPYVPLSIMLTDHSPQPSDLYVSARSTTGFTVSTRKVLPGGSMIHFDYMVLGSG